MTRYKFEIGQNIMIKSNIEEISDQVWKTRRRPLQNVVEHMLSKKGHSNKVYDRRESGQGIIYKLDDGFAWPEEFLEIYNDGE